MLGNIMVVNRQNMYWMTTRYLILGPDYIKQNVDVIGDVTSYVTGINLTVIESRTPILKCMLDSKV